MLRTFKIFKSHNPEIPLQMLKKKNIKDTHTHTQNENIFKSQEKCQEQRSFHIDKEVN